MIHMREHFASCLDESRCRVLNCGIYFEASLAQSNYLRVKWQSAAHGEKWQLLGGMRLQFYLLIGLMQHRAVNCLDLHRIVVFISSKVNDFLLHYDDFFKLNPIFKSNNLHHALNHLTSFNTFERIESCLLRLENILFI